jgi:hypothetical protein
LAAQFDFVLWPIAAEIAVLTVTLVLVAIIAVAAALAVSYLVVREERF